MATTGILFEMIAGYAADEPGVTLQDIADCEANQPGRMWWLTVMQGAF
jgi:hypothetical protein